MFKLKYNNEIKESFEKELDARIAALKEFKTQASLPLVEVLNENDDVIFTKERELVAPEVSEPTEQEIDNGIDSVIRGLIANAWKDIDDYNTAIISIADNTENSEAIEKLNSIIDDLNVHVGILESCLSK